MMMAIFLVMSWTNFEYFDELWTKVFIMRNFLEQSNQPSLRSSVPGTYCGGKRMGA